MKSNLTEAQQNVLDKINAIHEAMRELCEAWTEDLNDSCAAYPFTKSLDEVVFDVLDWRDEVESKFTLIIK